MPSRDLSIGATMDEKDSGFGTRHRPSWGGLVGIERASHAGAGQRAFNEPARQRNSRVGLEDLPKAGKRSNGNDGADTRIPSRPLDRGSGAV
jgi:hypothetical protein